MNNKEQQKLQFLCDNARSNVEKVLYALLMSETLHSGDVEGLTRKQFRRAVLRLRKDYTVINIAPHTYKLLWP